MVSTIEYPLWYSTVVEYHEWYSMAMEYNSENTVIYQIKCYKHSYTITQNIAWIREIARDRRSSAIFRTNVIFCDIERNRLLINVLLLSKETISSNNSPCFVVYNIPFYCFLFLKNILMTNIFAMKLTRYKFQFY